MYAPLYGRPAQLVIGKASQDTRCTFCLRQESMFSLGAFVRVRPSVRPNEFVDSKTLGSIGATPAKFSTHTPWVMTLACYSATSRRMCLKHISGQYSSIFGPMITQISTQYLCSQ